jgi:hypothetical protein
VFPFADLHSNAGARLRSEIELLPPTLFTVLAPFGSTTLADTDVINDSSTPGANPSENPEQNQHMAPVFAPSLQGETGVPTETDPAAPATSASSGSLPGSTSGLSGELANGTRTPQELPRVSHVRADGLDATRPLAAASDAPGHSSSAAPPGSAVASGSGAPRCLRPRLCLHQNNLPFGLAHGLKQVFTSPSSIRMVQLGMACLLLLNSRLCLML